MNFEKTLNDLESRYYEYKQFVTDTILLELESTLKELKGYNHIAIVGAGTHTIHLAEDFDEILGTFDIIDENPKNCKLITQFPQYKVYGYEKIYSYDCLIISSFEFVAQITNTLIDKNYKGKIVNIYKELDAVGLHLPTEYYNLCFYPYTSSIVARYLLQNEKYKSGSLKHLIYMSLHNRDLLWAKNYLEDSIESYPDEAQRDKDTLEAIEIIEKDLSHEFELRDERDIFAFWLDALRYDLSKEMPFINKCRERGMDFTNFYASAYSTRNTYGCMMECSDEIGLFLEKNHKNVLYDLMREKGYNSYRGSGNGVLELGDFNYKEVTLVDYRVASTKIIWDCLLAVFKSPRPSLIIIHMILETHFPYISPISMKWNKYTTGNESWKLISNNNLNEHLDNALTSAKYIDMELEYYLSLLLGKGVAVFFADHGTDLTRNTAQYKEDTSHLPLCIVGAGIEHKVEKGLLDTKRFTDILSSILQENEDIVCSDILQVNGIDGYNKNWIKYIMDNESYHIGMQYNGVRTQTDIYVMDASGEEFYYLLPNEDDNEITNSKYQERIQYLKQKTLQKHIDIYTHPKFKDSHLIYEAQGKQFIWRN